jgi:two-component system response regulator AtoC
MQLIRRLIFLLIYLVDKMTDSSSSILIVEDDKSIASSLMLNLESIGYKVSSAKNACECLEKIKLEDFSIILCDILLPDISGLDLIKKIKSQTENSTVILMSGQSSMDIIFQALELGAYDFVSKPFSIEQLVFALKRAEQKNIADGTKLPLPLPSKQKFNFSNIIAQSKSMLDIFETVKRLTNFNTTILITGESGTGKELIARAIHYNSNRKHKPFVAINCGAIPENLMESELFGHKKGSFTDATRDKKGLFEEASGGTIFLDEIGELPLHLQVKLLRALQEQSIRRVGDEETINVDLRIIAATLRNLEDDIIEGRFRDDLYYRLNVVSVSIPPLRERKEDVKILTEHFLVKHCKNLGFETKIITEKAMECLMNYKWRGNVRELENCIERAVVLSESNCIDLENLPVIVRNYSHRSDGYKVSTEITDDNLSIKQRTKNLEIDLIVRALKKTSGNRTHAARILEISHRALLYKLKEYGLSD